MSKRQRNKTSSTTEKKSRLVFKRESLSEIIETEIPSSKHRQGIKIEDIFIYRETDNVCSICSEANALSEFTSDKKVEQGEIGLPKVAF
jgi:hypothetical protein